MLKDDIILKNIMRLEKSIVDIKETEQSIEIWIKKPMFIINEKYIKHLKFIILKNYNYFSRKDRVSILHFRKYKKYKGGHKIAFFYTDTNKIYYRGKEI